MYLNSLNVVTVAFLLVMAGCGSNAKQDQHAPVQPGAGSASSTKDAIATQLAQYPLTTCVVTDEALGDHGKPVDHVYEGRLVRFCCKVCVDDFNKDPKKYLAKIDAAAAAKR